MDNYTSKKDAEAHWTYIEKLLSTHGVDADEIQTVGFHYKAAFVHGFKHGVEQKEKDVI